MNDGGIHAHALELARLQRRARAAVPVGAVLVLAPAIVGEGWRTADLGSDHRGTPSPAMRAAAQKLKHYRFTGAPLYGTLEPCDMCCRRQSTPDLPRDIRRHGS